MTAAPAADLVILSKAVPLLLPVLRAAEPLALAQAMDAHYDQVITALGLLTGQPDDVLRILPDGDLIDLLGQALDANAEALEGMARLAALDREAAHGH